MFKSKKFVVVLLIELIFPWLILVGGIPAGIYFVNGDIEKLEFFYGLAMCTVLVSLITEFIIGFVSFIMMLVCIIQNSGVKYSVSRKVLLWICSIFCIFGTLFMMLLVQLLTYARGI